MSVINVKCVDQVLSFESMPVITAGDKNVDQVEFNFCPLWDGFVKIAVFFQQREKLSYGIISADGVCPIPNSIMALTGKIYISVVGINGSNQTRTTNILSYEIGDGIVDAVAPEDFPGTEEEAKDFYNSILNMCAEMKDMYEDVLNNLAYVRIKDTNEFEYKESMLEAKIRAYTMSTDQILAKLNELSSSISSVNNELISSISSVNNELSSSIIDLNNRLDYERGYINDEIDKIYRKINNNYDETYNTIKSLDMRVLALESK